MWLLYQRKWNAIAGMGLAAGVLYLLGWIFDPLWVQHWLAALSGFVENRMIFTPTIWGFSYWITNGSESLMTIISVALILLLSIGLLLMLLRIKDDQPQIAVGAAIPIILMVMPYLWVYSQCALVLPLLLIWQKLYKAQKPYLITSGFLLLIGLFSFILVLVAISIGTDVNTIFIPALTLGLFYSFFIQRIVSGHIAVT